MKNAAVLVHFIIYYQNVRIVKKYLKDLILQGGMVIA